MKILLLNQTFYPDVVSTAQHLADLAQELTRRGHEVSVITSRRAYDNPHKRYPSSEIWRGIRIQRIGSTGFGKSAKWRRAVDFASFILACSTRLLTQRRPDLVVALTSPPLISFIGALYAMVRRCRFFYWVMDLNPDEAVAAGWLRKGSTAEGVLDWMSRFSLNRARGIIALDQFMAQRIRIKGIDPERIVVIPPWTHDSAARFDGVGRETFRRAHGLEDKFVIMYSGNHSPCHPLDTLMDAAVLLRNDPRFVFLFVGGGSEQKRVKLFAAEQGLPQVRCLPYQPLEHLAGSLCAADLHVVVMGDPFVGIIHPCKIYNILAVGAPFLYIGPAQSHISDLMRELPVSPLYSRVGHGQADRVVDFIRQLEKRKEPPKSGRFEEVAGRFSQERLLTRQVDWLTRMGEREAVSAKR